MQTICKTGRLTDAAFLIFFISFIYCEDGLPFSYEEPESKPDKSIGLESCQVDSFAGSRHPWTCRHGRDIQVSENRQYLMLETSQIIACCGYVIRWEFQASRRAQIRPIVFQIWRQVQDQSFLYQLIGQNSAWYFRDSRKKSIVDVPETQRVLVKSGDVIGWHTPMGDVIDYAPTTLKNSSFYVEVSEAKNVSVGHTLSVQGQISNGRMYGLKAVIQPVRKPVFTNLPRRVTFRCPVSQGHYVTDVTSLSSKGQDDANYSIEGYSPWFQVHPATGKIFTLRPIRGNFTTQITIRVTSTCEQTSSATLTLECIHLSEQYIGRFETKDPTNFSKAAMFTPEVVNHVTFKESLLSETILFDVAYENASSIDTICIISDSQPSVSNNVLYTSANLLLVKSNGSLTHNGTPEIHILLKCIHGNTEITFRTVIVHVTRDLAPSLLNLPATITVSARHSKIGDVIYHVTAEDRDSSALTISATDCSCPFNLFADGRVTVSGDLRGWTVLETKFNIFLSDGFNTVGPAILKIVITDQNHPPEFVGLPSSVLIPENSQGLVLAVTSRDPDDGDDVSIQWAWENMEAATYFYFEDLTNKVSIRPEINLDFESLRARLNMTSLSLLLTLDDGALQSPTQRVKFIVTDQNEAPKFDVEVLTIETTEGKAGSLISTLEIASSVNDPDINDSLSFHIFPNNVTHFVSIDRVTGCLRFNTDYDVDPLRMPSHMTFTVVAQNKGNLEACATVKLHIKNVNDPPRVSLPTSISVAEDMAQGAPIFQIYLYDKDSQDTLEINIQSQDEVEKLFDVSATGLVSLRNNTELDYERKKLYRFEVSVDDGHVTSAPISAKLRVTDVNEAPRSTRDEIAIETEEGKAGKTVSTFDLRDIVKDPENDELHFSILPMKNTSLGRASSLRIDPHERHNDIAPHPFSIDSKSGWLFLSRKVDVTKTERSRVYDLLVEARDTGGLSATLKLKVYLKFVNTAPALLGLPVQLAVLEDNSIKEVFQVRVIDPDGDEVIFRHHVEDVDAAKWVEVNDDTGHVKLKNNTPDLAEGSDVKVTIHLTAFDGLAVSEPSTLTVTVMGVNTAPRFLANEYSFSIDETEVGIPFTSAQDLVMDPDPGETLTFVLSKESTKYNQDVLVNSSSGELWVKMGYDIDEPGKSNVLKVKLVVSDNLGLTDTAQVTINIQDINDNPPEVLNDGDTFYVDAEYKEGTKIGQVQAQDRDAGLNGELGYQIVGSTLNDTNRYVRVDSEGWIVVLRAPQQESSITIYLAVTDRGWPMLVTMSTFYVIFKDSQHNQARSLSSAVSLKSPSSDDEHAQTNAIFILIGLIAVCSVTIMVLSYQLWKARSNLRMVRSANSGRLYQDYRFTWFPEQVMDDVDCSELNKWVAASPNEALSSSTFPNSCATHLNPLSSLNTLQEMSKDTRVFGATDLAATASVTIAAPKRQSWSKISLNSSIEETGNQASRDDREVGRTRAEDVVFHELREAEYSVDSKTSEGFVGEKARKARSSGQNVKGMPDSSMCRPIFKQNSMLPSSCEGNKYADKRFIVERESEKTSEWRTKNSMSHEKFFINSNRPSSFKPECKKSRNASQSSNQTDRIDDHICHEDCEANCATPSENNMSSAKSPHLSNTFRRGSVISNCPIQVCDDADDHFLKSKTFTSASSGFCKPPPPPSST